MKGKNGLFSLHLGTFWMQKPKKAKIKANQVTHSSSQSKQGPPYIKETQYITLKIRKNSGNNRRNRMSSRAWDISSRCFFRVKLRSVALRSSTLPLSAKEFSRLTEGDFLGTRGTPLVVPILILSNKPAYSISAPKTKRTQTMTQASIAEISKLSLNRYRLATYS